MCKHFPHAVGFCAKADVSPYLRLVQDVLVCMTALLPYNLLVESITMRTALLVACVLCATVAFGQNGGLPSMTTLQFPSHAQAASAHPMAQEHSLLEGGSGVTVGHGELPLWEVAPKIHEVPLGDTAREQKKEHANVKKAKIVWEN